ncbi:hypothetical protein ZIOFF_028412 [Zingiber officinale]|uniref:Tubby-like F-box protein n=1 Tax=Zingiber officinale TaxID=94328 RepID=A0A8J5LDT6_ZINOF|nr:hypothetical protein ZIOFF_028412 [Zingiber officinale]
MRSHANAKRCDIQFQVGDLVFLHLQPYKQQSLAKRQYAKLSPRFFGPYTITKKIGPVAYELSLPHSFKVHPVFHVSLLRRAYGQHSFAHRHFLLMPTGVVSDTTVLNHHWITEGGLPSLELLIQWQDRPLEEASWENYSLLAAQFPSFCLEERPLLKEGSGLIALVPDLYRSNFLGTKFIVYDVQPPNAGTVISRSHSTHKVGSKQISPRVPAGNYPVAHISYELNVLGSRGPRRMQCVMDSIPASSIQPGGVAPTQTEFQHNSNVEAFSFFRSKSFIRETSLGSLTGMKEDNLILKNKNPRWHEQLQCWCLNFRGRVTVASVKNFQLVASEENGPAPQEDEKVVLQFGKVGKDLFTMDYGYPISAFQAFAICLSSFDTKIACE